MRELQEKSYTPIEVHWEQVLAERETAEQLNRIAAALEQIASVLAVREGQP